MCVCVYSCMFETFRYDTALNDINAAILRVKSSLPLILMGHSMVSVFFHPWDRFVCAERGKREGAYLHVKY